jgi:phosphate transport system substrate-binding protein
LFTENDYFNDEPKMNSKNEAPALILTFLITTGLVGGGLLWLSQRSQTGWLSSNSSSLPSSTPTGATPDARTSATLDAINRAFTEVQGVPSGLFSYGGSTTWAPIRLQVDSAIQAARPEFRLRYTQPIGKAPGSGTGIKMLIQGELVFAQSSRSLHDEEYQQARQRGIQLTQIPVAIDGLVVVVNPNLPIAGLTLAQLVDIYRSKITNWQAVGGPNLAIVPITRPLSAGGTVQFFDEQVLQKQPFGATVQTIPTTTEALRKVAQTPGALYYASAPEAVPQCTVKPIPLGRTDSEKVPPYEGAIVAPADCPTQRNRLNLMAFQNGQYPLTRNLYVIVNQNGKMEQQAGEAYANLLLSAPGQALIEQSGFVKIR